MTQIKRLQDNVTKLTGRIDDEERKADAARTRAEELDQQIAGLIVRAIAGEAVDADLTQAKKARSDSMFDQNDHLKAANTLRAQLVEAEEALQAAERAAAAARYAELTQKRNEADKRIEAAATEIVKAIKDLLAIDAQQRLESHKAGIVTGRAAKPMIEDYIVYKLKPVLGNLLPRVTTRGEISEIDSMAQ